MKCFEFGLSMFLDIDLWVKWINILAVIIASLASYIAYKQFISGRHETRNAVAYNLYHNYLSLCLQKPEFANGMIKPQERSVAYGQYCWFVSNMLFTFEQILNANEKDEKWLLAIKSQLILHKDLLKKSSTMKNQVWSKKLQNILDDVVNN